MITAPENAVSLRGHAAPDEGRCTDNKTGASKRARTHSDSRVLSRSYTYSCAPFRPVARRPTLQSRSRILVGLNKEPASLPHYTGQEKKKQEKLTCEHIARAHTADTVFWFLSLNKVAGRFCMQREKGGWFVSVAGRSRELQKTPSRR